MAPLSNDQIIDHWTVLRSNLHDPSSWSNEQSISLTYVPTLAGFSGPAQLTQFCSVCDPTVSHPFHPTTAGRFNNRQQRLSIAIDKERGMICEELVMSFLHNERLDWLLPAAEPSRRVLNVQFTIVGQLEKEQPHLLHTVRIYWNHACVLKEAGLLSSALQNAARLGVRAYDEESFYQQHLLIPEGAKVNVRLTNPTPYNCNQLSPLDSTDSPMKPSMNMAPLLDELPKPAPRNNPAFKSHNVFMGDEELLKSIDKETLAIRQVRDNPAFTTTMEFKDDFEPLPADPRLKEYTVKNIFVDPNPTHMPGLSIDQKKNQSNVFGNAEQPVENFASPGFFDESRFTSSVFSGDSESPRVPHSTIAVKDRFESHVFEASNEPSAPAQRPVPQHLVSHFNDQSHETEPNSLNVQLDPTRFKSHIDFQDINMNEERVSVEKRIVQSTNILLGCDTDVDTERHGNVRYSNKSNKSSLVFDFDNPKSVQAQLTTRYP